MKEMMRQVLQGGRHPSEVRKLIYTTNAIEGFNRQLRKVTKSKTVFPAMTACLRCFTLQPWTSQKNGPVVGLTGDRYILSF